MGYPLTQVEATKFTEVGFHGRDVDQIIRDLVDAAIISTRVKMKRQMRQQIAQAVEDKILDSLLGSDSPSSTRVRSALQIQPLSRHSYDASMDSKACLRYDQHAAATGSAFQTSECCGVLISIHVALPELGVLPVVAAPYRA